MIELTESQREEVARSAEGVTQVLDPATNTTYVLVRADVYEKLLGVAGEDDVRAMEPLLAELAPEDWVDPAVYEGKP